MESNWVREKIVTIEVSGKPILEIATPLDFWPNSPSGMFSPEDLFLAAAISCYGVSIHGVSKRFHTEFSDFHVKGTGNLIQGENGWEFEQISIFAEIYVSDSSHIAKMEKVAEKAHQYCVIANSMKCPVHLDYKVVLKE